MWRWLVGAVVLVLVAVTGVAVGTAWDRPDRMGPGMMGDRTAAAWGGMGGMGGMGVEMGALDEEEFLAEMIAHHEEAITAAGELARSDRPEMRDFGADIVRVQSRQVEQMQAWLDLWYDGGPSADYRPMMRDLSELEGDELDEAFLVDMIDHHHMAVMMSQHALMRGDLRTPVRSLARDIRTEQAREIQMMARWLHSWFDTRSGLMPMHHGF